MKLQKPKGTQDIFGKKIEGYNYIMALARAIFENYNVKEVATPIFESYDLFSRATGEISDIVTKEMYDFEDKGGRHIALRPEATASVVRAYVENKFYAPEIQKPVKLWYQGSMFRYERPQSGRLREFHQLGVESFGVKSPAMDADMMFMVYDLFTVLGLKDVGFNINSLGDNVSRNAYREALVSYLSPYEVELSEDSKRRLIENPLRILDSKDEKDKSILADAPSILNYLTSESQAYFETVQELLNLLEVPYKVDHTIVRGLDYYNDVVFEATTSIEKQELTLCAGGRYDELVSYFDGPETPAFGFAIGLERLLMVMEAQNIEFAEGNNLQVYIAVLGKEADSEAVQLLAALHAQGISADRNYFDRKIIAQYKAAENFGAELIITLGVEEVRKGTARIRNSKTRKEIELPMDTLYSGFNKVYERLMFRE